MTEGNPPTSAEAAGQADALDMVEIATAVLVRNFELLRRRSDIYAELDRAEYLLLRSLEPAGSSDIRSLACALGLDPSTVGRQVAVLERKQLVSRKTDPADRRCSIISPTEEGRRRMVETQQKRRQSLVETLGDWEDPELREFGRHLLRYNRAIAERYLFEEPQPRSAPEPLASQG